MNTLTLTQSLMILAGLVLLAVLLQAAWKMRRAAVKKAAEPVLTAPGERLEPALGANPEDDDTHPDGGPDTQPELGEPGFRSTTRPGVRLDALIDAMVPLALEAPVTGDLVLAHLPATRRAGAKPFYIEGLDSYSAEWERPEAGRRYSELQAGVQLANRTGPLNQIEYSEFVQTINTFADAVGAAADFPDMTEVVARARELDGLTSELDAQLTLTLRSNSVAWSVRYVQQCAARHGFVPGVGAGRFVLPSAEDGAPPVLQLTVDAQAALAELDDPAQSTGVRSVNLLLDVPQTPQTAEPYPAWHGAATALASDMDATLVDDHGQPVVLAAFATIAKDLKQLYGQLEALDLAAGSAAARRLFS